MKINIRDLFLPTEDNFCFVDADWAQVENRIGAILTQETFLLDAFTNGEDIYKKVYAQMFKVSLESVTKIQRQVGKQLVLGLNYGMGAKLLSEKLKCSYDDAVNYIELYWKAHSNTTVAKKDMIKRAQNVGFAVTHFGRKRYLPKLNSSDTGEKAAAEREVWNTYIQGTAADILKASMNRLHKRFKQEKVKARLVFPIHDEILTQCSAIDEDPYLIYLMVKEAMEIELRGTPLPVEGEYGWRFGSLKKDFNKFIDLAPTPELKDKLQQSEFFNQVEIKPEKKEVEDLTTSLPQNSYSNADEKIRMVENDFQKPALVLEVPPSAEISNEFIYKLNQLKTSNGFYLYFVMGDNKETYKLGSRVEEEITGLLKTIDGGKLSYIN